MEISVNGSVLIIKTGPATFSYPVDKILFDFDGTQIDIKNGLMKLFSIKVNTAVTIPSSTSMSDLYDKLNALK